MKKIVIYFFALCFAANVYAYDFNKIQIHGFISQGYLQSDQNDYFFADTEDGTFQFNEIGINFATEPFDNLRLGIQLLSRDLGNFGNNDVEIDWAYGDYRYRNWLGIRAGKMKMPHGLYNQSRDVDAARTGIFLPISNYNESFREGQLAITGASLYGVLPWGLEYQVLYGKLDINEDGPVVSVLESLLELKSNNIDVAEDTCLFHIDWNVPLVSGLKLVGTYLNNYSMSLDFGFEELTLETDTLIFGTEYLFDNFAFAAEYKQTENKTEIGEGYSEESTAEAYFGMISYRFTNWFELGTSYSVIYRDKDDRDGESFEEKGQPKAKAWLKDFVVSTRFDINDNWLVKLEGHFIDGLAQGVSSSDGNPSDNGFLFAVKTTFSF